MAISHYLAPWSKLRDLPNPSWPGLKWREKVWDKDALREIYQPWRAVEEQGVEVHIGEFGCYKRTPNDVALGWLSDLLEIYQEFKWGYSLWNFEGPFGIIGHDRPGVKYETVKGYSVDRELLELLLANRILKD